MKRLSAVLLISLLAFVTAGAKTTPKYVCSLTGKKISNCCCTHKTNGKLYCKLAKKTITSCCSSPPAVKKGAAG